MRAAILSRRCCGDARVCALLRKLCEQGHPIGHTQQVIVGAAMSQMGQKHRFDGRVVTSGLPQLADIFSTRRHVSNVPKGELMHTPLPASVDASEPVSHGRKSAFELSELCLSVFLLTHVLQRHLMRNRLRNARPKRNKSTAFIADKPWPGDSFVRDSESISMLVIRSRRHPDPGVRFVWSIDLFHREWPVGPADDEVPAIPTIELLKRVENGLADF
jgi:hypothetical protein